MFAIEGRQDESWPIVVVRRRGDHSEADFEGVLPNAAIRGASKVFLKLANVTADVRVVETAEEAFELTREALRARGVKLEGVPLPSTLVGAR